MPKSSKLSNYGPEFEALLLRADAHLRAGHSEFIVDFLDSKAAHSVRFACYAYFKALRNDRSRPDLVVACQDLSMRLASGALVFHRSNDSNAAAAIRTALNLPKLDHGLTTFDARPSTLDANLDKLRGLRGEKTSR
jgi:hypothetical protein